MTVTNAINANSLTPLPKTGGGTGVNTPTISPTSGAYVAWDTNSNLSANSTINGYASITSAAGTTTLSVSSAYQQIVTGSTTQTIQMPVVSTLILGQEFKITNNSTGLVTVNSSGGNLIGTLATGNSIIIVCSSTSGTTAASWTYNLIAQTFFAQNPGITFTGYNVPGVMGALDVGTAMIDNVYYSDVYIFTVYQTAVQTTVTSIDLGNLQVLVDSTGTSFLCNMVDNSCTSFTASKLIIAPINITISSSGLTSFSMPLVTRLVTFSLTANSLSSIDIGSVNYTVGAFSLTSSTLTSLNLSNLVTAASGIAINASSLTSLNLSSLSVMVGNLSGTMAALTSLSIPNLTTVTTFSINCSSLTSLTTTSLTSVNQFSATLAALTVWSFNGISSVMNLLSASGATATSVSFSGVSNITTFTASFPSATTINFSSLATIANSFAPVLTAVTSYSFPALATVSGPTFTPTGPAATSVDFSSLATLSSTSGTNTLSFAILTTLSLPALVTVASTNPFTITAPNLTTFSMNSGLHKIGGNFILTGAALNQASVDGILVSLAALDGTGGTTAYSSHTVNLSGGTSSTPSATGLTAKTTLQGRGCTVTTN